MNPPSKRIAIACGGTGGHLFPGLAVAEQLMERGCDITLLVSPKEVDQQALRTFTGAESIVLPAVGLTRGRLFGFLGGFARSYRAARRAFASQPPWAALAMGGFTCAPPLLAAKRLGARTFLHESNAVPGRANRWLSWFVDRAFLGFPSASARLHTCRVTVTGTPVRHCFQPRDAGVCRTALGLAPARPVVLVMGGSQGASGINKLVLRALPLLARQAPELQWFHLTGPNDLEELRQAYAGGQLQAVVHPFFDGMETALGAATVAISRAGASSLAELAAMRVPSVLVPYPLATDNHQFHNAHALEETGAARLLDQKLATPELLAGAIVELARDAGVREKMQASLTRWQTPRAAAEIAETILAGVSLVAAGRGQPVPQASDRKPGSGASESTARRLTLRPGRVA